MPDLGAADSRATAAQPLPGITEWKNARNGVFVCEVHYSADEAKRTPEWKKQAQQGLPKRGWLREFEIVWEIPEGEPVFPEYSADMRQDVPIQGAARILRFWDFGHVCPVTLFAQVDLHGRLIVYGELVLEHQALDQQILATQAMTLDLFGRAGPCFDAGDPAGEKMMDLGQVRNVLMRHGILLHCQPSNAGSYENLRSRLLRKVVIPGADDPSPALIVTPRAPVLHSALAGGFHKNAKTGNPVDVHPYKDVCDALRYGNDNLTGASSGWLDQMRAVAKADCAW